MGWSESYWEDVRADWARLQSERRPADEDEILDSPGPSQPADTLETPTRATTDLTE
jgi:hypothetical protein